MFHAARRWWGSGRLQVLTRLFLFEFIVVVTGVLAAQGLADWVNARAEDEAVVEENSRIRYEMGRARQTARVWLAAAPCLEQRVEVIIRKASVGGTLDPGELRFPDVLGYTVGGVSPDIDRAFRARIGNATVDTYGSTSSASELILQLYRNVARDWDRLALLDPALGEPSQADRATVRDIGVQIRSQLRRLQVQAKAIEAATGRLGIAPITSTAESGGARPIERCEDIWRTGRIWRG